MVSGVQGSGADIVAVEERTEVQGSGQFQYRLRYAEGSAQEVQRAKAEHSDRLQGQTRSWSLDRRYQCQLDWVTSRQIDLTAHGWRRLRAVGGNIVDAIAMRPAARANRHRRGA